MDIKQFIALAPAMYKSGTALEVVSGPGVGKSSAFVPIVAALSKEYNEPFGLLVHIFSGMDPADVKGFLFPTKEKGALGARFSRPSLFPTEYNTHVYVDGALVPGYAEEHGVPERGILLADEFGQADQEVQKPLGQLILDNCIGEYKLPEGWRVWAASNRLVDKSGVVRRLRFLQNRSKTLTITPSYLAWVEWAMRNDIHPLIVTFAKRFPSKVFADSVPASEGPFPTPRSLVLCADDLAAMKLPEHGDTRLPMDELAMEVAAGWLGDTVAADLIGHIRMGNDLPEPEEVAKNAAGTRIPARPDAQFVMASMLAHHVKRKTMPAFIRYTKRMGVEMQVMFCSSVTMREPGLISVPEFSEWITENQDLLMAAA